MSSKNVSLVAQLDEIISGYGAQTKQASAVAVAPPKARTGKKAEEANREPDYGNAPTTESPSKDVDDKTQPAEEGSRAKENDDEVAKLGVESGPSKAAKDAALTLLRKRAEEAESKGMDHTAAEESIALTGEDPTNEVEGQKSNPKVDPGTSTPVAVDNKELDGSKYASMTFDELLGLHGKAAEDLYTTIHQGLSEEPKPVAGKKAAAAPAKPAAEPTEAQRKKVAQEVIGEFIFAGSRRADLVAARVKQASAAKPAPAKKRAEGPPPMDPMAAAGGGAPPMDPMAAAGGGGAPPMDPMAGGGAPPMDPAAGGGAPPMEGGGEGGGDVDIAALLQQLGIPEDKIQEVIAMLSEGGEGGGEAPPMDPAAGGGEAPPEEAPAEPAPPEGAKAAAAPRKGAKISKKASAPKKVFVSKKVAQELVTELMTRSR